MARRRARSPVPRTRSARLRSPAPRPTAEQLATAAAHDLATFRATLELEAELVRGLAERRQLDPELRHHLVRLVATGRALSHIGAHFVEVLRSDPSRDIEAVVPLAEVLTQAQTLFRERAARRGLRLEFEPPPRVILREHANLVRHLLLNLLDNAIKFSDRGVVRVRTRWAPSAPLRLEVRDEGASGEIDGAGFGIGLGLMRELMRPLGGTLERQTTSEGTCVVAVLPLQAKPEPPGAPERLRGVRVVVACDDPEACRTFVAALRRAGAGWICVPLGEQALGLATAGPAAMLILSGGAAPGRSVLGRLRALKVPAVVVTGRRWRREDVPEVRWVSAGETAAEEAMEALADLLEQRPPPYS